MSTFSEAELACLNSQPLGRIATVDPEAGHTSRLWGCSTTPEAQSIVVGSAADMAASKKFRDAQRHRDVALVVDDLATIDPWTPRGIAAGVREGGSVNLQHGATLDR